MTTTHIIENGVVVNTIMATVAEAQAAYPQVVCIEATSGTIGWVWDGSALTAPQVQPQQPTLEDFDRALSAHLDSVAKQRRYDNRISCMVRAGFPGPFQAEGIAFATWCDNCNKIAYSLMAEVQTGLRQLPSSTQELIDILPEMVWPD